ncbi:FAD-dependent monooxygenase [Conexibacter stalactiti]|uniref:FAD-dependent monooxygenase n=1 Tax=Conexibacter stalactiti TaxID=1940611 RepID=A0ABU4HQA8_9ACTN|nr:FAD-dependent monooxygenase [Conexibacter stalactiti]MDW5595419.1 FAD-dependent monooxygenase [Conexibacter stalactiti]MEC5036061.1 FAD-dependent monooxygenase [Conexibacter stalactiti]
MSVENVDVLVVGAGPTGLLLAAELQRRDVPCLLVDALDAPRGWDRATVVHARSMEILEALGIERRLLAEGVRTRAARFHSDGDVLGELDFGASGSRYGFDIGISEEVTEAVLTDFLHARGGAVTRATRLVGLSAADDAVTATLESGDERREVLARWVVGCDGIHSVVREAAGIPFPGADIDVQWAVFDATAEGWDDDHDVVFPLLDTPPVILTPLPGRRWRVYMRPTSDASDLVAEAQELVRRYKPGVTFTAIEHPVRFRCHSRVAARYRSGRLLLAGDAAHACTPAEGHGMNTGLQDAFNLGWKLALVCRGEAGAGLLDTYESERRPVAERIVASGADVEVAHALTAAADRAERDASIRETFGDPDSAHHEAASAAEIDRQYPRSRIVAGEGAALAPGRRLPDTVPVKPLDGEPLPLHELTHQRGLTLIVLGGPDADPGRVGELVTRLAARPRPAVDAVVGFSVRAGGGAGTLDHAVAAQLGVTGVTVLAVRPDRYIGLRDDDGDAATVEAWLDGVTS